MKTNYQKFHIRQQGQSDCGVACLASIIQFFGGKVALERLRDLSGTSKQGTTLLGLKQAANQVGLSAEAYEADIPNLKIQTEPCLLHVIMDERLQHYVVCYGYDDSKKQFIINDPGKGIQMYSEEELDAIWQSKALLLVESTPDLRQVKNQTRDKLLWLKSLLIEDLNLLVVATAMGVALSVLGMATAVFSQKLIDDILPSGKVNLLVSGLVLLTFLLLVKNGIGYLRQYFLIGQSRDFNIRLINRFYGSLLSLPKAFFDNRKTGELVARMNDTSRIQKAVVTLSSNLVIDVLTIIVTSVAIILYAPMIGVATLLWIPVFMLLIFSFHKPVLKGQQAVMSAYALNESHYIDTISGVGEIKVSNSEPQFTENTRKIYGFFQDRIFNLGLISTRLHLSAEMAGTLFMISVIGWSAFCVLKGDLNLGAMMAILQMIGMLMPAAGRIAMTNIQIQEARVAYERMYEFAAIQPEYVFDDDATRVCVPQIKSVAINNLSFRFPGSPSLLENISLSVGKGELVALLGESGCGKTTLLKVLQKFYKHENGQIRINESIEWNAISTRDWRSKIAVVPQEVKIFNGSLLDNIVLANPPSDISQLISHLDELGFGKLFRKLPNGYATLLGEEGINISGGQRQLVGLARAIYKNPQLLLLDEATSAMDRNTEAFALSLLNKLKEKTAIILLTHRIQTAALANRIYVIENKAISASGSHSELLKGKNLYQKAWNDILSLAHKTNLDIAI